MCVVEGEIVYIYVHDICNVLLVSAVLHTARYRSRFQQRLRGLANMIQDWSSDVLDAS